MLPKVIIYNEISLDLKKKMIHLELLRTEVFDKGHVLLVYQGEEVRRNHEGH